MVKTATVALADPPPLTEQERAQSLAASRELAVVRAEREYGGRRTLPRRRMTEQRWTAFIQATRQIGGDIDHAAALCDADRGWTSADAFRQAIKSDPLREREWRGAVKFWESKIQQRLFELGVVGRDVPIFQGGELVGHRREYSEKVLLALGSHYLKLIEKRQDSTLHVQGSNDEAGALLTLTTAEALQMPLDLRRQMVPVLEWLRHHRAAQQGDGASVPALTHDDGAVDVEFVEGGEELAPLDEATARELEAIR